MRILPFLSCVALLAACSPDTKPTDQQQSAPVVLAFHAGNQIKFADATGRVWGDIGVSRNASSFVWSADSKYFAWLEDSRVHIVEAANGTDHAQPCPCSGLNVLGDRFATINSDGTALLLLDPTAEATRVPLRRPMPYAPVQAGGTDQVVVAEQIPEEKAAYRGQSALTAIDRDGNARLMIEGDSAVSIWNGFTSPDGSRIVTIEAPSSGACYTTPGVLSLHSKDLNPRSDPLAPVDTPFTEAVLGQVRSITSINWAGASAVVTFGPNTGCQTSYPARYVTYSLTGTTWQYLRSGVVAEAFGRDGRTYAIELPEDIKSTTEDAPGGKLILTAGDRKELADGVHNLWPTPAEQAAGHAQPAPPVDHPLTTTDYGKPIAPPFLDLTARLAKALESNDTATLTALCNACDHDTQALLATPAGLDSLRLALRTHPSGDDRSVTFPGLVMNSCVDSHDAKPLCTKEQIRDIGTLKLPSTIDSVIYGERYSAPVKGSVRFVMDKDGTAHWTGQSISAQNYRQKDPADTTDHEMYFFKSPNDEYICGFDSEIAACQGKTAPVPPRPSTCPEGVGWGYGLSVARTGKVDFLCSGGVMFYPIGREPADKDKLGAGQSIAALGYTCTAEKAGIRCTHDSSGHGFLVAPTTNEQF